MERYDQATRLAEISHKPAEDVKPVDWHKLSGGYHFGRRPFVSPDIHKEWNFLQHHVPEEKLVVPKEKGLASTKFHNGFNRRTQDKIQQSREREEREVEIQRRKEAVLEQRRKNLEEKDKVGDTLTSNCSSHQEPTPLRLALYFRQIISIHLLGSIMELIRSGPVSGNIFHLASRIPCAEKAILQ